MKKTVSGIMLTLLLLSMLTLAFNFNARAQNEYALTVTVLPSSAAGSVSADILGPYHLNDNVTLTPTANPGYTFSNWTGDGVNGAGDTRVVTVSGDMAVNATFTQNEYALTVTVLPSSAAGSVSADILGPYHLNDNVTLTPTANPGYTFSNWTGDGVNGAGDTRVVTVSGDMAVNATFTQNEYALTVTVLPSSAAGSVSADILGPYHLNDNVTLTPTANPGYTFSNWTGDGVNGAGDTRVVTVSGDMAVNATFTQNEYALTVNHVGSGSVTKNPDQTTYTYGTVVTLIATADPGWTFTGWTGDLVSTTTPDSITMTGDKTVTAVFYARFDLTVDVSGSGSTNVTGVTAYDGFSNVTVLAMPDSGYRLSQWLLNGTNEGVVNPYTVNMTGNYNLTAVFARMEIVNVTPCDAVGNPKDTFAKGTLAYFKLVVNDTSPLPANVLITVNIYDSKNVTIGVASFQGPIMPGVTTIILGLPIPTTANLGGATVYVSAFTDWISRGGVPYCPEMSATFGIKG